MKPYYLVIRAAIAQLLRKVNENLIACLSGSVKDRKSDSDSVLHQIDETGFLLNLNSKTQTELAPSDCERQIAAALAMWKRCQAVYRNSQDSHRTVMVEKGLGAVFATIGCAVAKLEKFETLFLNDPNKVNELKNVRDTLTRVKNEIIELTGETIDSCAQIGIRYRHLDRLKRKTIDEKGNVQITYYTAEVPWKVKVQKIMTGEKFAPKLTNASTRTATVSELATPVAISRTSNDASTTATQATHATSLHFRLNTENFPSLRKLTGSTVRLEKKQNKAVSP